ncbi:hypothetical protein BT69DRAFT_1332215 [Atractiella rhizophila]|nr:hypothetical protein BT69DRAFT_1332215 [Atractiella rhizophila]
MSPKAAARKRGRPAKRTAVPSSPAVNTVQAVEFTPMEWTHGLITAMLDFVKDDDYTRRGLYPENGARSTSIKKVEHYRNVAKKVFGRFPTYSQWISHPDENIAEQARIYYGALVKSKLEYLDKRYEQLKSNMSSTGAGLTEEEVRENPEARNKLDATLKKFPYWWHMCELKGQRHNIAAPSKGNSATPIDIARLQQKDPQAVIVEEEEGEVDELVDEIPSFVAVAMKEVLSGNGDEEQDSEQLTDEFVVRKANVSDQLEPGHLDNAVCAEEHPFSFEINANHVGIALTGDVPGPPAVLSDESELEEVLMQKQLARSNRRLEKKYGKGP